MKAISIREPFQVGLTDIPAPQPGANEALLTPVRRYVAEHAFFSDSSLLPEIRVAALGGNAGIIGAAALVP